MAARQQGGLSARFGTMANAAKRKSTAVIAAFTVLVATPVTLAVIHEGYPVTDTDLYARDVWVTNESQAHAGRINMQIAELNGFTPLYTDDLQNVSVMQDGDDVFVYDAVGGRIERITPAFATLDQRIEVPSHSDVSYNAGLLAIARSVDGALWIVDTNQPLAFDPGVDLPIETFGVDAATVVSASGIVYIASPEDDAVFRVEGFGGLPEKVLDVSLDDFEITTVGDDVWILDRDRDVVIDKDGIETPLGGDGLRIQQAGPGRDYVVVATGDGLLLVGGPEDVTAVDASVATAVTDPTRASAPVVLGSCVFGAWTGSARYVDQCGTAEPRTLDIPGLGPNDRGEFRVNRDVIVFNNFATGDVFLVTEEFRIVDNWDIAEEDDTPQEEESGETTRQTFEQTLAERTEENHAPVAREDEFGVRPGKITIIPVLDNDTDEDGDVLTVAANTGVPATFGTLRTIDDGRALLFEPAAGATGSTTFRYTASDGRPGGVAEATVVLTVHPYEDNEAPNPFLASTATVEAGGGTTYNVLADWIDPDGDDIVLVGASTDTGDIVQFQPNGEVTFVHRSAELGEKVVTVVASDGREERSTEFTITVQPSGSLAPVGVPDNTSTFPGVYATVEPLKNDLSPSGDPIFLTGVEVLSGNAVPLLDLDAGSFDVTAPEPGTSYLLYHLESGVQASVGIVRVDVVPNPDIPPPPVAVPDTAYLRANEPLTVAVLGNDVSPSGAVLGVQSVTVPPGARYTVELLDASLLRISSSEPLSEQQNFTYVMSDGINTATGGVTIVPVPELSRHQAPQARPDTVTVRAGDIATVDVMANDVHPDGVYFGIDPELHDLEIADGGVVFVSDERVRVQAPAESGLYTAVYGITDTYGEKSTSTLTILVTELDEENNEPPEPRQITERVYAGGTVTVELPAIGMDPNGDSVTLAAVSGPNLGMITGKASGGFEYTAFEDSAGTDEFVYVVEDRYGATATGLVRIGVIPRSPLAMPPNAVDDTVAVRPGFTVAVPVLENDSDPNGYTIELLPELLEVQPGVTAAVDEELVIIEAGLKEGLYGVRYEIVNENGATDSAYVLVEVDEDAPIQYPYAPDHIIEWDDAVGQHVYTLNPFDGALNPSGHAEDLVITIEGVNASMAEIQEDGTIDITLADERRAISYRLTNPTDGLSAVGFIVVPKYLADYPPYLITDLETQIVPMNTNRQWDIADLVYAPSGKPVIMPLPDMVSGTRTNGDPVYLDATTLSYTPEFNYRGPASITFEVTDGTSIDDREGVRAILVLPIIVGDPEYRDYPPSFTTAEVLIEAGEDPVEFDLRAASSHPNPEIKNSLDYYELASSNPEIAASISDGTLSVSAPFGTQPGTTSDLTFSLGFGDFEIPGAVTVRVVPSTRPLAQTTDDIEPEGRMSSVYVMSVLANDFNPFAAAGESLEIVDAVFEGDPLGASLSHTSSAITVTTGGAVKSGTVNVIYTVRDATDTAEREVTGRASVVIASAPEPVSSISLSRQGSGAIGVIFGNSPSSNGASIQYYTVNVTGGGGPVSRTDCLPGVLCTFSGRTNGSSQTVTVTVTNRVGTTGSPSSPSITPYGTPSAPVSPHIDANRSYATASIRADWSTPSTTGGGAITYEWRFINGSSNSGSTTGTASGYFNVGAGSYRFEVRACNPAGCSGWVTSSWRTIDPPPPPPPPSISMASSGTTTSIYEYRRITLSNYSPNRSYTIRCYNWVLGGPAPEYQQVTINTNSSGNGSADCRFSHGGPTQVQIWARVGSSGAETWRDWV